MYVCAGGAPVLPHPLNGPHCMKALKCLECVKLWLFCLGMTLARVPKYFRPSNSILRTRNNYITSSGGAWWCGCGGGHHVHPKHGLPTKMGSHCMKALKCLKCVKLWLFCLGMTSARAPMYFRPSKSILRTRNNYIHGLLFMSAGHHALLHALIYLLLQSNRTVCANRDEWVKLAWLRLVRTLNNDIYQSIRPLFDQILTNKNW